MIVHGICSCNVHDVLIGSQCPGDVTASPQIPPRHSHGELWNTVQRENLLLWQHGARVWLETFFLKSKNVPCCTAHRMNMLLQHGLSLGLLVIKEKKKEKKKFSPMRGIEPRPRR